MEKIERTKQLAREELGKWAEHRLEILSDMEDMDERAVVKSLFDVADQLTGIINECIDIYHPLTPEIVGLVSAIVLGITKGDVVEEVERLLGFKTSRQNLH